MCVQAVPSTLSESRVVQTRAEIERPTAKRVAVEQQLSPLDLAVVRQQVQPLERVLAFPPMSTRPVALAGPADRKGVMNECPPRRLYAAPEAARQIVLAQRLPW